MIQVCHYCSSPIPYGQGVYVGGHTYHISCAIKYTLNFKQKYQDSLLNRYNVLGVGVGWRYRRYYGFLKQEICIVVNVVKKVHEAYLPTAQVIPKYISDIKTDVLEIHEVIAPRPPTSYLYTRRERIRPAVGGVSIGHINVTAGTLGCLVRKDHEYFILSNNHVLANENEAYIGDPILQPGPYDGGRDPEDRIAYLDECIPLKFNYGINYDDAALARPIRPELVSPEIMGIGKPIEIAEPMLGMKVVKSGRTTGITYGEVIQIATSIRVKYNKGYAFFDN